MAEVLESWIKEKSQKTRSVANERSGRYVVLKVLQMKMELQRIGSRFNKKQICHGSSKDVCAISQLSAAALSLGAPPPRGYQVDGFLEKRFMDFFQWTYINTVTFKGIRKHRGKARDKAQDWAHYQRRRLLVLTPYRMKIACTAYSERSPMMGTSTRN